MANQTELCHPRTLVIMFLACACLLWPGRATARTDMPASLELAPIGDCYVNIAVANSMFGSGMNDAFDATIRRVRPKTAQDLQAFMVNFDYMSGDGGYQWEMEGNSFQLYKVSGGERKAMDLFAIMLPDDRRELSKLRIFRANPGIYKDYNLATELNVLGVMGVSMKGPVYNVEFINGKKFAKSTKYPFPAVAVSNADNMLKRYAFNNNFTGIDAETTIANRGSIGSFDDMMYLFEENKVINSVQRKNADELKFIEKIGGYDLPKVDIRYEYIPCTPNGNTIAGSPKALFLPVKVNGAYPIFVFPAALTNKGVLESAVKRELYHAQWWLAAANLAKGISIRPATALADFTGLSQEDKMKCILREGLMRTTVVHMAADIDAAMGGEDVSAYGSELKDLFFSHRYLIMQPLAKVMNNPQEIYEVSLPWTVSEDLIIPEKAGRLHFSGSVMYNNALYAAMEAYAPSLWETVKSKLRPAPAGQPPPPPSDAQKETRLITEIFASQAAKPLGKQKDAIRKQLVDAIIFGYANDAAFRTQIFSDSADAVHANLRGFLPATYATRLPDLYAEWSAGVRTRNPAETNLMVAALNQGFAFSDLEWLLLMTGKYGNYSMPFSDLGADYDIFGKRLQHLVFTEGVSHIRGLRLWQVYLKITKANLAEQIEMQAENDKLLERLNDDTVLNNKTQAQQSEIRAARLTMTTLNNDIRTLGTSLKDKNTAYEALMQQLRDNLNLLLNNADVKTAPAILANAPDGFFNVTWPALAKVDLGTAGMQDVLGVFDAVRNECDPAAITAKIERLQNEMLENVRHHNTLIGRANARLRLIFRGSPPSLNTLSEEPLQGAYDAGKSAQLKTNAERLLGEIQGTTNTTMTSAQDKCRVFYALFREAVDYCTKSSTKIMRSYDGQIAAGPVPTGPAVCAPGALEAAEVLFKQFSGYLLAMHTDRDEERKRRSQAYWQQCLETKEDYKNNATAWNYLNQTGRELDITIANVEFCGEMSKLLEQRAAYQAASDQAGRAAKAVRDFVATRNRLQGQADPLSREIEDLNARLVVLRKKHAAELKRVRELITLAGINDATISTREILNDLSIRGGTILDDVRKAFYTYFGVRLNPKDPPPDNGDAAAAFTQLKKDLEFLASVQFVGRDGGVK